MLTRNEAFAPLNLTSDEWRPAPSSPLIVTSAPEDRVRVERARALWREARSIDGTPATSGERRLLSGRGAPLAPCCPFGEGVRHGCMIALVNNIITNEPQAIHRTAIDVKGRKIGRKAYGPICAAP